MQTAVHSPQGILLHTCFCPDTAPDTYMLRSSWEGYFSGTLSLHELLQAGEVLQRLHPSLAVQCGSSVEEYFKVRMMFWCVY